MPSTIEASSSADGAAVFSFPQRLSKKNPRLPRILESDHPRKLHLLRHNHHNTSTIYTQSWQSQNALATMHPPTAPQRNTKKALSSVLRTCPTAPTAARVRTFTSHPAPTQADTVSHSNPNQAQPDRKGKTEEGIRKAKSPYRRRCAAETTSHICKHRGR